MARECLVYLILILVLTECLFGQSSQPTKTVLVIFDEHTELPGLSALNQSIRNTLSADSTFKTDIYTESMNLSRFQREGYAEFLRGYYKEKYKDKKIDVVIAALSPSLTFALNNMEEIAPGIPIVFCGVDPQDISGKQLPDNVTGVLVKRDFTGTLDVALEMQPETKKVVFIGGTSDFDKRLLEKASSQLRAFEDRVTINYLTDRTLDDILKEVSQLPPDTIILYSTVFKDASGATFVPHDVVTMISNAANVPVYGFVDQYLGLGIVGGRLYSVEAHGKKAAEAALRILHGAKAADVPVVEGSESVDMFDERQLKRWNINQSTLPPGSLIEFKQRSFWEEYQWYIAGVFLLLTIESLLIGLLVYLQYRRRQAEREALQLQIEAQEISGHLITAQEHERARLARELHDDACQNLALLSIELELLGRTPPTDSETLRANIKVLSDRVAELSDDLRDMSHELHPARLARLGLGSAIRGFCNEIESTHALKIEFTDVNVPAKLPGPTSLNFYRIVQEAIQNILKHSGASRASVTLSADKHVLSLLITDNGKGFDPKAAGPKGSLGLISMRERIRLLRGKISIDSRPGGVTRINVSVPILHDSV